MITTGDVDDRKPMEYKAFVESISSKQVGNKGYVSKELFQRLFNTISFSWMFYGILSADYSLDIRSLSISDPS